MLFSDGWKKKGEREVIHWQNDSAATVNGGNKLKFQGYLSGVGFMTYYINDESDLDFLDLAQWKYKIQEVVK